MSKRLTWQKAARCVNCKVPAKCWLCADCWRMAIVAPVAVFLIQGGLRIAWEHIFK